MLLSLRCSAGLFICHEVRRVSLRLLRFVFVLLVLLGSACGAVAGAPAVWRAATVAELEGVLPARAPVEKERIETEMRTATGIIDERGQMIASVVLITAGYAADGRYSHYFLAQAPVAIGEHLQLAPGAYVVGWKRAENGLVVHFYEAASGVERGAELAVPAAQAGRVESFHIWPPSEGSNIQIGRFFLRYRVGR